MILHEKDKRRSRKLKKKSEGAVTNVIQERSQNQPGIIAASRILLSSEYIHICIYKIYAIDFPFTIPLKIVHETYDHIFHA